MSDLWTIIGTVASISGGFFAWYQAHRAKGYYDGIKDGKKDAKEKSTSKKLADINALSKTIRTQLSPSYIQSKTPSEIQTLLEQYLTDLSDKIGAIAGRRSKTLKELYDLIDQKTPSLSNPELSNDTLNDIKRIIGQVISESSSEIEKATFK